MDTKTETGGNMKFHEAVLQMKPGDVFIPSNGKYGAFLMIHDHGDDYFTNPGLDDEFKIKLAKSHFNLDGEIKRPAPKVLSAGDYAKTELLNTSFVQEDGTKIDWYWKFVEAFNAGDKNGQNREYYRPEQVKLREAIENELKGNHTASLELAYYNLKPPTED